MTNGSVTVEIKGLEQLQRKFGKGSKVVDRESRDAMEKSVVVVHDRAGTYPPQRPTWYVRTGLLGSSFAHRVETYSGGVRGIVDNPVSYAPLVRGDDTQASVHAGHWATMKQIVVQRMDRILGFFEQAMQNLAKILGD